MMDFITRLNIERFERLLRDEKNPEQRALIQKLLTEERRKAFPTAPAPLTSPPCAISVFSGKSSANYLP